MKERVKVERRTSTSLQQTQGQDNKSTSALSSKERRKIYSGNRCFRTCNWRSTIPGARREMEIDSILSRTMQPAERNYKIYNKELLAIVEVLTKWRQYLLDVLEPFEIWTDYKNLKYIRELHKLNEQQARWYLKLQDYNFTLQHIPGKTNTKADILLRKD